MTTQQIEMAAQDIKTLANTLRPLSEAERKVALETTISLGAGVLTDTQVQEFLNDLNAELGSSYKTSDFNCMKSSVSSAAEVKKETEWFTASNSFIAGAIVGTVVDQVINDLNVTSAVAGTATAAAGYLLRDQINERGDTTAKKLAWGTLGGAVTIAASYGARGVMGFFDEEEAETPEEFA